MLFHVSRRALIVAAIGPPFFTSASPLETTYKQSSLPKVLKSSESEQQRPLALNNVEQNGIHKTAVLEIEQNNAVFGFPLFLTSIAIGTPPQPFCMLIDLDYGGMAVRSNACRNCGRDIFSYNSSATCTSHDANCTVNLHIPASHARGSLFQDEIHLASALLTNATFASVDEFGGENWEFLVLEEFCDGQVSPSGNIMLRLPCLLC